ncbi:MAG TPA: VOC family protein [Desulfobacterales bacterium]|nr:VOC family protein [Desulfobacterales bacterium]HIP38011.1 VOC family protein [Desulfocapsa sulfexigens]
MDEQYKQHGAFSWCELITPDVAEAKAFYEKLFGWVLEDMPMEGMTYTIVKAGGREVGGIMTTPPEAEGKPPAWGTYVTVDDVDELAGRVAGLGGNVLVGPQDIPEVGRFCVIQDPQGAFISAITYIDKIKNA